MNFYISVGYETFQYKTIQGKTIIHTTSNKRRDLLSRHQVLLLSPLYHLTPDPTA